MDSPAKNYPTTPKKMKFFHSPPSYQTSPSSSECVPKVDYLINFFHVSFPI